jgi:hypothetical protein
MFGRAQKGEIANASFPQGVVYHASVVSRRGETTPWLSSAQAPSASAAAAPGRCKASFFYVLRRHSVHPTLAKKHRHIELPTMLKACQQANFN